MTTEWHNGQCGRVTSELKACKDLMYHILTQSYWGMFDWQLGLSCYYCLGKLVEELKQDLGQVSFLKLYNTTQVSSSGFLFFYFIWTNSVQSKYSVKYGKSAILCAISNLPLLNCIVYIIHNTLLSRHQYGMVIKRPILVGNQYGPNKSFRTTHQG